MTHLSPDEFVDLADGVLAPARAAHVGRCERCRTQADEMQALARQVRDADLPAASPLVWPHFHARVRDAIDALPAPRRASVRPVPALAAAMVMAVALALVIIYPRHARDETTLASPTGVTAAAPAADQSDDPAWSLLREVAGDMAMEDAHAVGIGAGLGTADRAVLELTPDERTELQRLLKDALKHGGA